MLLGVALPGLASAQMFHLFLACRGTVAAGPGAASPADTGVVNRGVLARSETAAEGAGDKNVAEHDENLQARARAVRSAAKRGDASLDLALRDNNMSMLVQRSNVLPTGQRLRYQATPSHYTATFVPQQAAAAWREWNEGWMLTWYPPFQRMAATRFSIDRQTGVLEGEVVGPAGEVLGLIDMQCEPRRHDEQAAPKF